MTDYVDVDELKTRLYFISATLDERFLWKEVVPTYPAELLLTENPGLPDSMISELGKVGIVSSPTTEPRWADGFRRFRLIACAHRPVDRDGLLCTHCGDTVTEEQT
jgi:hypothetical protein